MSERQRRVADRRQKWWLRSPQQWLGIATLVVWFATELLEYLRNTNTVAPPWLMEALVFIAGFGIIVLRAAPFDNEQLKWRDPKKKKSGNGESRFPPAADEHPPYPHA